MWIISNSSGSRTVSTGCEVIATRCSFVAPEQLSGNRSSATESWTVGTGYPRWWWMRILCRRSKQDMTDTTKIWEIKARQLLIPSSTSTSTSNPNIPNRNHNTEDGNPKEQIQLSVPGGSENIIYA